MDISGYPILTLQPDFATEPQHSMEQLTEELKISPAPAVREFTGKHPQIVQNFEWMLTGEAEIVELEEFFVARKGKWGNFWMPTWHEDLTPAATLTSGDNELSIEPVGYLANFFAVTDPVTWLGNHIYLLHEDGTFFPVQVTGVSGTDPEVLTLGTNAPQDFELGRFTVGFLVWSRFLDDEADFQFNTPETATVKLSTTETIAYEGYADV